MLEPIAEFLRAGAALADNDAVPWKTLVVYLLWAVYLFETYVALRQYRQYSLPTPPKALVPYVSLDTFAKSQRYGRDKARTALMAETIMHIFGLLIIRYEVYARAWSVAGALLAAAHVPVNEMTTSAVWVVLMSALREVVGVPLSAYRTFVIEERHGFNKQTPASFVSDTIKEWLPGLGGGMPLVALIVWVIRWAGDYFVAYTAVLMLAVILFGSLIYPTLIQPLFNKLTPLPDGVLRDRVLALARTLRFPLKHLYVIDGSRRSSHSNAYFYGIVPGGSKHIGSWLRARKLTTVIYDTLISESTPDEIEAVLAHELGHWSYSHPTKLLIVSLTHLVLQLTLFSFFIHNASLYRAFGFGSALLPVVIGLELFQLVLNPADALTKFAFNAAMRRMEFAADRYVVAHVSTDTALPRSSRALARPMRRARLAACSSAARTTLSPARRWPSGRCASSRLPSRRSTPSRTPSCSRAHL